jgi:hypothetical protein
MHFQSYTDPNLYSRIGKCVGRLGYDFQFPDVYYEVLGREIEQREVFVQVSLGGFRSCDAGSLLN